MSEEIIVIGIVIEISGLGKCGKYIPSPLYVIPEP